MIKTLQGGVDFSITQDQNGYVGVISQALHMLTDVHSVHVGHVLGDGSFITDVIALFEFAGTDVTIKSNEDLTGVYVRLSGLTSDNGGGAGFGSSVLVHLSGIVYERLPDGYQYTVNKARHGIASVVDADCGTVDANNNFVINEKAVITICKNGNVIAKGKSKLGTQVLRIEG